MSGYRRPRELTEEAWMADAACRGRPSEWFFAEDGTQGQTHVYDRARRVCAGCPVADECLAFALRNGIRHGFWGRRSPRERQKIVRARRSA